MQNIVVTPQVFLDLFILCLSWKWDPSDINKTWTTVDKVSRILYSLGIINKKQKLSLYKDWRGQRLFYSAVCLLPGHYGIKLSKNQTFTRLDAILQGNSSSWLVIGIDPAADINKRRLLRDYRLHLTNAGKTYADSIASKYESVVTKEIYLSEVKRQEEKKPKAMEVAMTKYRKKIKEETEEE